MLGGFRKTMVGGAALGLLAIGLSTGVTAPAQAATGDTCVIVGEPADVYNIEYGLTGIGHANQKVKGQWQPAGHGQAVNRYGLYYPVTDPVSNHAVPRMEGLTDPDATSSIPMTPVQTGDHFRFAQTGKCANNGMPFRTDGNAIGYCGRSVGLGIGKVGNVTSVIRWESVASQLVMLDPSARGSVNAQPNIPNDPKGSCVNGEAITFLVDGAISDLRPAPYH